MKNLSLHKTNLVQNLFSKCEMGAWHQVGNENKIIGKYLDAESALRAENWKIAAKLQANCANW